MLKIYGIDFSRAYRVYWAADELGLAYESVPVSFKDRASHTPPFLAANPNARLPAIDDDGVTMFESLAISLYLAKKTGGPLAPQGLVEDGHATMWSIWALTELEKLLMPVMANGLVFPAQDRRPEESKAAMGQLARPFAVLNGVLSAKPWLLGDRFTIADLNVAAVLAMGALAEADFSAWPAMCAWLDGCLSRPAAKACRALLKFKMPRPPQPSPGV